MSKPIHVEIGRRYVLRLPPSLPADHQLAGLRDELQTWLQARRPGNYDPVGDCWLEDEGTEPASLFGHHVVTVHELTVIQPRVDEEVQIDGAGNIRRNDRGQPLLAAPRWSPLDEPIPAAVLHLSRSPDAVRIRVPLTPEQIINLDMGLDVGGHYIVAGHLVQINDQDVVGVPNVDEWADIAVPVGWLRDLDEVQAWSEGELATDLTTLAEEADREG